MPVRCANQPVYDLCLEEGGLIFQRLVSALQQFEAVNDAGTTRVLLFLGRRDAYGLTEILLRKAQQLPPAAPEPVEALDHQHAAFPDRDDCCFCYIKAERAHQLQAVGSVDSYLIHRTIAARVTTAK